MKTIATRRPAATLAALLTTLTLGLGAPAGTWAQPAAAASAPAAGARAELAKPVQAAQQAIAAKNYPEALARLAEAEAMPNLSPYESYLVLRTKAPALFGAGELAKALDTFEQVLPLPDMPEADRQPLRENMVRIAVQLKDYPRALKLLGAYLGAGGSNAELRALQPQLMAITGDDAGAVRVYTATLAADDAAGRTPTEPLLRRLAASQDKVGDKAGYLQSVERLAGLTGKPDYWQMLAALLVRQPGFAEDRLLLDVYRLRRATGLSLQGGELADMAYRAQQAGLPAEAKALLDEGFAAKLLGEGAEAANDRKLRDQVNKAAAQDQASWNDSEAGARQGKDGNALVNLGMALSGAGQHERALALMNAGVAKGGLRRPDEVMLHLGLAQWRAGQTEAALKTLAAVGGSDGTASLARLWTLHLKRTPAAR